MDLAATMAALEKLGNPQTKKTWLAHGATGELFGVKIGDLKVLAKKLKGRQDLALELYATGNLDAMYLAGLIADGAQMTRKQLEAWVKAARWQMIAEYTVPFVAAESPHARDLALKWIDSGSEAVASAGWNTYAGLVSTRPDDDLDLDEVERLLQRAARDIDKAPNRVRYAMNGFVIAVGCYVKPLVRKAKTIAKDLKPEVDMGGTACKVPPALASIQKVEALGRIGKKRATVKC